MESVNSIDAKIVALLHDTLEDGKQPDLHLADIEASYGETIAVAIDLLTKNPNVSYQQYIKNLAPNELAREVKIADLRDNMRIDRLPSLGEKDFERLKKYHWAHNYLTAWSEEEEDE
jgi:(p)ppGpp synthase/HD superfamily hydrolase